MFSGTSEIYFSLNPTLALTLTLSLANPILTLTPTLYTCRSAAKSIYSEYVNFLCSGVYQRLRFSRSRYQYSWCHWEQRFGGSRTEVGTFENHVRVTERLGFVRSGRLGALVATGPQLGPSLNTPSVQKFRLYEKSLRVSVNPPSRTLNLLKQYYDLCRCMLTRDKSSRNSTLRLFFKSEQKWGYIARKKN